MISIDQRWQRNHFEISRCGRNPFRPGEFVVIVGCPPRGKHVSFKRESNGVVTTGYHPNVFKRYFSRGYVLYEDGKYKLNVNGLDVIVDTLAEVEALQVATGPAVTPPARS